MAYDELLVIDWRVVNLSDPRYDGVVYGNVLIARTGSISLNIKGTGSEIAALQVKSELKTVTVNNAVSITANYAEVSAIKFASGDTVYSGTVNFGSSRAAITVRTNNPGGDGCRATGISGGNLTFGNAAELSPLTGNFTITAAATTRSADSARATAIDAAILTIYPDLGINFAVTATGGKGSGDNRAEATALDADEIRLQTITQSAGFTINATGGKDGAGCDSAAYALLSSTGDIEIDEALNGRFNLTARGGSGSGNAGAKAVALNSARDIRIGETVNALRITINATGGTGGDGSRADSAALCAAGAIVIDGALYTFWTVNATGGKGGDDAGAATTAIDAASLAVAGLLSGTLNSTARGGNAVNAEADATGFSTSGTLCFDHSDRNFRMTLQATGGTATASADAAVTGISAGPLAIIGDALGNYTLRATGGNGTGSADADVTGWNGGAISVGGALGGSWNLTATGGRSSTDSSAIANAIDATGAITIEELTANFTITARGGSNGGDAEAEVNGITTDGNLTLGSTDRNFRMTLQATGGNGTASADAAVTALCADTLAITGDALGNYTLRATGGTGTTSSDADIYGWNGATITVGGELGGSWTLAGTGNRSNAISISTVITISAVDTLSLGKFTANFSVTARGGSNAAIADAIGIGLGSESIQISDGLSGNWNFSVSGGQNTTAAGGSASAYAAGLVTADYLTIGGDFAGKFNLTARGGNWNSSPAEAFAIDAGGDVTLDDFAAGAKFILNATGGYNGTSGSASAAGISAGTILAGDITGAHSINATAGNTVTGSNTFAAAETALIYTLTGDATLGKLSGSYTTWSRSGANATYNSAYAYALCATGDLELEAIDKSFRATLTATTGNNGVASTAVSSVLTGNAITVTGEFAGTYNINATGGKTRTGAALSSSSAIGTAALSIAAKLTIGSFGQTRVTLNVRGGSDAIANQAAANAFYGETGLEAGTIGSNVTLTVNATGGNGAKVATASSESVSADAVARAFATGSGALTLTDGMAATITVNATAGSVNDGEDTSAGAIAHGFYAGVNSTGQLAIAGAIAGSLTVRAVANHFSETAEAAARAVGFGASGGVSLGSLSSTFRLTVSTTSIQNADARAVRSSGDLTVARLGGAWNVTARGGGTYSSGNAAAHAFTASQALNVTGGMATTLKVTLGATGGNATLTGNAFTDSRVFYSIGSSVTLAGGAAGTFTVTAASSKAIYDSYSLGYFISALGVAVADFDAAFKLKVTTKGGTSYNGDGHASSYGIFGGTGAVTIGTLAGTFELAATGGVGSAAELSSPSNQIVAGSTAAIAIGVSGQNITLAAVNPTLKMKLTAKAGISLLSSKSKTANAETRVLQSKNGPLTVTGGIGGTYELTAGAGMSYAGKYLSDYNAYAAANAIATLASGSSISLGDFDSTLKFTALAIAGSVSSETTSQTGYDAQSESNANAVATVVIADGNLSISQLAGNFTMASRGGSATATAVSEKKAIDMNAVAIAAANAVGTGLSGNSVTLNQVDSGLRIVISAAAGKATATASKLFNDEDKIEDSGTASATASAYATASGIRAESGDLSVISNQFNGLIAVTAFGGSATANNQAVSGDAVAGKSYGIYSAGAIYGADAGQSLVISKVIAAAANTEAYAVCGNGLNLTVNGALYAGYNTNAAAVADALARLVGTGRSAAQYLKDAQKLDGNAYAVKSGDADDLVSFGSGSIAIGNIDLGGGANTLSLTHQSQLYGNILSSDGGTLELIINIGGDSSSNPIITVGSDAGKTLGDASISILIGAAQLGSYVLVKNGGDYSTNSFTVNGLALEVGGEIRLANGTYVSLHIDSKNQLIFTAGAGHNSAAAGDNQLYSAASTDPAARQLLGGTGDDLHLVRNSGDTIAENAAGGTDTVVSGASYTLGDNLENLFLHGSGDLDATGNADANRIAGNSGNNILDGGGGDDSFIFSENWGHDLVRNDGGSVELLFADGLRADDLTFEAEGDDLVVTEKLTGSTIRVEDWALNSANSIRFGDDLYFNNYLLRSELGCFATLETLSGQSSTKNASLAS